jgi:hypothetical protein
MQVTQFVYKFRVVRHTALHLRPAKLVCSFAPPSGDAAQCDIRLSHARFGVLIQADQCQKHFVRFIGNYGHYGQ